MVVDGCEAVTVDLCQVHLGGKQVISVIPIHQDGKIIAVLDIDSPVKNRFSAEDSAMLSELVRLMEQKLCWD